MSILTYPFGFIGGGVTDFYNGVIENSLLFDVGSSDYLDMDYSIDGNKYTYTYSFWYKGTGGTARHPFLSSISDGPNNYPYTFFYSDGDQLKIYGNNTGNSSQIGIASNGYIRDPSAWHHIVLTVDTPTPNLLDRVKLYHNGRELPTTYNTNPDQNEADIFFNRADDGTNTLTTRIGNQKPTTAITNGMLKSDIYFIDGHALGPEAFGEWKKGVWIPKAYAGPPPLITDSSSGNLEVTNTVKTTKVAYDEYYLGDSSIVFDGTTTDQELRVYAGNTANFGTNGNDFTIDLWVRRTVVDEAHGLLSNMAADQTGWNLGIFADGQPYFRFGNGSWVANPAAAGDASGFESFDSAYALNKWRHLSATREGNTYKIYVDGVLAGSGTNTTNITDQNQHLRIGRFRDGDGSYFSGYLDEIRIIKGEAQPPRFYFGTTYGDQDGGRLAHRATTEDRFTDDERTLVLVSGQSANTPVRAVCLVDESGFHSDNVHSSNSTIDFFPTQDGVGQQFTISGPQHTTRESFVGNTSSIATDGADDYFTAPDHADWSFGTGSFTVDFWVYRPRTDGTGSHISIHTHGASGADVGAWGLYTASAHGVGVSDGNSGHNTPANLFFQNYTWHHVTWVRVGSSGEKIYVDGIETGATGRSPAARDFSAGVELRIGHYWGGEYTAAYYDEIRVIKGAVDKPQIKWTHTQTAGAGNKAPYDVHGWRAHGHEFTDDNATKLLIHGDDYENISANSYFFDGTNDYITTPSLATTSATYTWACWFKPRKLTDTQGFLFDNNSDFLISTRDGSLSHYNYDAGNGDSVRFAEGAKNYNKWNLAVVHKNGSGLIRWYINGIPDSNTQQASPSRVISGAYSIGGRSNGTYSFKGYIAAVGIWDEHDSLSDANILAMYNAGPTLDWRTSYSGDLVNYWAFGNLTTNHSGGTELDTGSAIYDRTSSDKNITTISGAVFINDGGDVRTFKDSSSANSIHHALISGGGVHHSKAVTLKSDGTNGTSTTDEFGNTIYWCGSNSTVTFANSSSFDYGNTAMAFRGEHGGGNYVRAAAHADFTVADDNPFTMECWVNITQTTNLWTAILDNRQSSGSWHGVGHLAINEYERLRLHSAEGTIGGTSGCELTIGTWHHILACRKTTVAELYRDGVMIATGSYDGELTGASYPFTIGESNHGTATSTERMIGYVDEAMYMKEYKPPRFYLGNQAPISGSTLSAVKSIMFTRGDTDEYKRSSSAINTFMEAADYGTVFWWCKQFSMDGDALIGYYGINGGNVLRWGYGADGYREMAWFTNTTVDASKLVYPSGKPGGSAGISDINDDGEWVFGGFTVQGTGTRSSGGGSIIFHQGIGNKLFVTDDTFRNSTGTENHTFFGTKVPSGTRYFSIGGGTNSSSYWHFNGLIAQVGIVGGTTTGVGSPGVLSHEQLKAIWELGPAGDARTITAVGDGSGTSPLQWYFNANLESGTRVTDGTAMYDLVTTDGTTDLTTVSGSPVANTSYIYASGAKRLSASNINEESFLVANTSYFGNNHFANTTTENVTSENFGGFVDDEYTVLLLRGGHADDNTGPFTDGGAAAGETITFPAHSYSYGKSRVAKTLVVSHGSPQYEFANELGMHGTSIKFDGTDSIQVKESGTEGDDFWFEDGNFCVEAWLRLTTTSTSYAFGISNSSEHANTGALRFSVSGSAADSGMLVRGGGAAYAETAISITAAGTFSQNTWYHIAIQRNKSLLQTFINGRCMIHSDHTTVAGFNGVHQKSPAKFGIGSWGEKTNARWVGEIDELRVTKGIARYTPAGESQSGIVPSGSVGYAGSTGTSIPTTPYLRPTPFVGADGGAVSPGPAATGCRGFFANTNVKLWVKSDSYPGDTNFVDSSGLVTNDPKRLENAGHSAEAQVIRKTGNINSALSGGSDAMYFDGTDYIIVPKHQDNSVGLDDFTIEFWGNATWTQAVKGIIAAANSTVAKGILIRTDNGNGKIQCYLSRASWGSGITTADALPNGVWTHIAVQRDAKTVQIFINGVSAVSGTEGVGMDVTGYEYYIGRSYNDSTSYVFTGYLDEIRISKMARYTGQGLIDSAYPNPSTEFGIQTEGSTYGRWDTQVTANTTYQRYNYQHTHWLSTEFDGTNDYAKKDVDDWQVSDDRGSIVVWFKPDTTHAGCLFATSKNGTDNFLNMSVHSDQTMKMQTDLTSSSYINRTTTAKYLIGEWNCFVLVGDGTSHTLYHNGSETTTSSAGGAAAGSWLSATTDRQNISIGALVRSSAGTFFDGRISQVAYYGGTSGTDGVLTTSQINDIYILGPAADLRTANSAAYSSNLLGYWTFGNKTTEGTDTASTIYDQSAGSNDDLTGTSLSAPDDDTKLLIHSNATIDGDTTIVDSSPSAHIIDRGASDPVYANSNNNRSSLGYNAVLSYPEVGQVGGTNGAGLIIPANSNLWTDSDVDTTIAFWINHRSQGHDTLFSMGTASPWTGQIIELDNNSNLYLRTRVNSSGSDIASQSITQNNDTWYHITMTRIGSTVQFYQNGVAKGSGTYDDQLGNNSWPVYIGMEMRDGPYGGTSQQVDAYLDQIMIMHGVGLTSTQVGHLYGTGNANTTWGTLGGLNFHEEYSDGTNTANAATTLLIHSNNATYHSQGSRKFYNDVANTRFTTTTGHEAAGRFTIGASSGIFTVLGAHQTGYSPAMNNPTIRLRRGYSYIFSASSLSSHKLYFANSTSDYAASGTLANQYIGGQYGYNGTAASIDGTETWTAFSAGHFLGGNGTTGQWGHMKFEVPTNAPKDLYYRCAASGHEAMGNAVYVMEATEPAPVKVGLLPAIKTSTWNDRDYAGIGTNKSVIHMLNGGSNTKAGVEASGTQFVWAAGTEFAMECWFYNNNTTWGAQNLFSTQYFWADGTYSDCLQIRTTATDGFQVQFVDASGTGGSQTYETFLRSGTAGDFIFQHWHHVIIQRNSSNIWSGYMDGKALTAHSTAGTAARIINAAGRSIIAGGSGQGGSGNASWNGFMDEYILWTGINFNANTVIERYQAGRAGNHYTANSSCVLHIKADSTYGDTTFTDSSSYGSTLTSLTGEYHHIDDNRTANTALYFDGYSYLRFPIGVPAGMTDLKLGADGKDYCIEAWVKPMQQNGYIFYSAAGTSYNGATNDEGLRIALGSNGGVESTYFDQIHVDEQVSNASNSTYSGQKVVRGVWNHICVQRFAHLHSGYVQIFINGVLVKVGSTAGRDLDGQSDISIGGRLAGTSGAAGSPGNSLVGWMDGIRITNGMPRYTSGIPLDAQAPHKKYDDGRSANTANGQWTSSSTRRYYGINTHTYLQTSEYGDNANTILMVRGDDAVTANDGVNMYGHNGFHLEFKEVGKGLKRDYNNQTIPASGLGSDTSSTQEFSDEATLLLLRSRPNQANGSNQFINEVDQSRGNERGSAAYHSDSTSLFSVDSNTANVSIASGGSRTY